MQISSPFFLMPMLSFLLGGAMKVVDFTSKDHDLKIASSARANSTLMVFMCILCGAFWVLLFSLNNFLGTIYFLYALSYLLRGKIDDWNLWLAFAAVIIALVLMLFKVSSFPFSLVFSSFAFLFLLSLVRDNLAFITMVVLLFFIWPLGMGFFHDKKIWKLVENGKRPDIRCSQSSLARKEISVSEVMRTELPHTFAAYGIPFLLFLLVFPTLGLADDQLTMRIFISGVFYLVGYETARYWGTKKLQIDPSRPNGNQEE